MRHCVLHLLLFIALVFQGVAAVAGAPADRGQEQHCAGHDAAQNDCACCPEGLGASMSCTAQCSVSQAPFAYLIPVRLVSYSTVTAYVQRTFAGPNDAPLIPPPIV
jgi:hypothetical protein